MAIYADRVRSGKSADRERELSLAQNYFERAIDLHTKFEQQEDLAISLNNLAELYRSTGRYAAAEPLYVRALEILEQSLGINHPNTQTIRENLQILRQTPATE
ncbi:tetratricopeptide repeat protein [Chamaesiphon minutus]|uniref:tetratricopeptide repeat protein n=1 Tax=Chamaesiphon minutus TaxID=1173032 RepID=UPI0002F3AE9B|nr:tetratricopeptide repeat protein [Chamaesiphon minutus]